MDSLNNNNILGAMFYSDNSEIEILNVNIVNNNISNEMLM